ncbi:uncharacterized protein BP5553_06543 [Venustampulla echinocandica]|uniref:Uncharacterized protein n=1 Tax=Venustampulla echinocandica TaxID=2656787 RepID=A0A370TK77_9HELO|nr:uncharacterized protein BP5553_06543 [Venustampulla echinocandica]RDL35931.1 hypothetical protein BP5553_06543 [Venustampulla echinocandica]
MALTTPLGLIPLALNTRHTDSIPGAMALLPPPKVQPASQMPKQNKTADEDPKTKSKKLPRLSNHHKISKRPLLHPPIASPNSSSNTAPKVIYISSSTPFISTIKRVRKLLSGIEARQYAASKSSRPRPGKNNRENWNAKSRNDELRSVMQTGNDQAFIRGVESSLKDRDGEEVILKATGKAIERLLSVAAWFMSEGEGKEFAVSIRTGSVGAIDDVVSRRDGDVDADMEAEELGSRVRRTSCLEVGVRFR